MPADGIFQGGTNITIRNCTFLNLDVGVDENRYPDGVLVQDCSAPLVTGLRGCFIWAQGEDQVAARRSETPPLPTDAPTT